MHSSHSTTSASASILNFRRRGFLSELLERHRGAVEKVAHRLSEANRIDGAEVAQILEEEASARLVADPQRRA